MMYWHWRIKSHINSRPESTCELSTLNIISPSRPAAIRAPRTVCCVPYKLCTRGVGVENSEIINFNTNSELDTRTKLHSKQCGIPHFVCGDKCSVEWQNQITLYSTTLHNNTPNKNLNNPSLYARLTTHPPAKTRKYSRADRRTIRRIIRLASPSQGHRGQAKRNRRWRYIVRINF